MKHHASPYRATKGVTSTHSVFGAPCWVSLTSRDVDATVGFYNGRAGLAVAAGEAR
ncbi:hypothetical protein SALBM311S_02811 [Streptomyces alboniger]